MEEMKQHQEFAHHGSEPIVVEPPPDGDVAMAVCDRCEEQFYTLDPAVLATHLADHEVE